MQKKNDTDLKIFFDVFFKTGWNILCLLYSNRLYLFYFFVQKAFHGIFIC